MTAPVTKATNTTPTNTTPTTTATVIEPLALLRLFHLVSPALPVGAYAYSQGLEYAVHAGWVHDEASTFDWLQGLVRHALGTLDLPLLARLHAAFRSDDAAAVQRCNAELIAARESSELRAEERHLGSALAKVLIELGLPEASAWRQRDPAFATLFSLAAVRWGVARRIVIAWIVTMPMSGLMAALAYLAAGTVLK